MGCSECQHVPDSEWEWDTNGLVQSELQLAIGGIWEWEWEGEIIVSLLLFDKDERAT